MTNLFDAAVNNATSTKTTSKSDNKVTVTIPQIANELERLATVQSSIADLEAEETQLMGIVKDAGINAFVNQFKSNGQYPGSFRIAAGNAAMLFVPQDKYITIDEIRANELTNMYGDVVEKGVTYTMNTALVEKYGAVISKLISECKEISDADKAALISASVKYSVKKGTIETANKIKGSNLAEIVTEIKPIFQIKGVKLNANA